MRHVVKVAMVANKNVVANARITMKATTTTKVALEIVAHAARVVAFVHAELRRMKTTNAELGFFEIFSNLLYIFVALES
jgi:hypothetical protein